MALLLLLSSLLPSELPHYYVPRSSRHRFIDASWRQIMISSASAAAVGPLHSFADRVPRSPSLDIKMTPTITTMHSIDSPIPSTAKAKATVLLSIRLYHQSINASYASSVIRPRPIPLASQLATTCRSHQRIPSMWILVVRAISRPTALRAVFVMPSTSMLDVPTARCCCVVLALVPVGGRYRCSYGWWIGSTIHQYLLRTGWWIT
mmetsp:Transcript_15995/g.34717  ORF Transcript_15995/g.34717 Transcript_15995/m.34717 type:complete len:206 (-) Transcript_15995:422-1039(-)